MQRKSIPAIIVIGLLVLLSSLYGFTQLSIAKRLWRAITPRYQVEATYVSGAQCEVRVLSPTRPDEDFQRLIEVRIDGRVVYQTGAFYVSDVRWIELPPSEVESSPVQALAICEPSGGSGGRSATHVFEWSIADPGTPRFTPLLVLHDGNFARGSDPASEDQGVWLQGVLDHRYWIVSGAASTSPVLRARLTADGPRFLDPRPCDAPSASEIDQLRAQVAGADREAPNAVDLVIGPALSGFFRLAYAGRAPDAWRFFRACHAAGVGDLCARGDRAELPRSLAAWESALLEQLDGTEFADEVRRRNGGSFAPPGR